MKHNKCAVCNFVLLVIMIYLNIINASTVFADEKTTQFNGVSSLSGKVQISFLYTKQKGIASNQFAVWIEDTSGKYIKTLYATRFTSKGGWKKRSESIPTWVKSAQLQNMSSKEIDAITGATPSSGNLIFVWDCKDYNDLVVPAGEYRYFVEGTLRWKSRVLYSGTIKIGGSVQQSQAKSQFFGEDQKERNMINEVIAKYYP
jgi:hypothetical protein